MSLTSGANRHLRDVKLLCAKAAVSMPLQPTIANAGGLRVACKDSSVRGTLENDAIVRNRDSWRGESANIKRTHGCSS